MRLRELLGLRRGQALGHGERRSSARAAGALRALTLGVGNDDGVALDAAVFAGDGLVGRVVRLSARHLARAAGGRTRRAALASSFRGPAAGPCVVGTGWDTCQLKYVPNLEDLKPADVLLTAGTDGIFPPGVPVGVVTV